MKATPVINNNNNTETSALVPSDDDLMCKAETVCEEISNKCSFNRH